MFSAANPEATLAIMLAMKEWMSHTCLSFVQRTVEKDYIEFFMNCSGYVTIFIFVLILK